MNYLYKSIEHKQCICKICRSNFNQIYNNDVEMNEPIKKINKSIILSSLIQNLKDNVDELENENKLLKSSLDFYKNIYYRNVHKLC